MSYDLTALSVLWHHRNHPWVKAQVWENETERQTWHLRMGRFGVSSLGELEICILWNAWFLLVNYCSSLRWFIQDMFFVCVGTRTFFHIQNIICFSKTFGDSLSALDSKLSCPVSIPVKKIAMFYLVLLGRGLFVPLGHDDGWRGLSGKIRSSVDCAMVNVSSWFGPSWSLVDNPQVWTSRESSWIL